MSVSVIVRARDQAKLLERLLRALSAQEISAPAEVVVVDNGSQDGTGAVAARNGAHVIGLPREQFSFGRALNLGAAAAGRELLVALSADALPPDPGWLARMAAALADEQVACASGERRGPAGERLRAPVVLDAAAMRANPRWGYSNAAGAFRAELWRRRPFREDLPGCEDKEWARHWLADGYVCRIDPALVVEHDHSRDPLADLYARGRREEAGYAMFLGPGTLREPALVREWWSDRGWHESALRARLSPRRLAWLLGREAGRRAGARAARRGRGGH